MLEKSRCNVNVSKLRAILLLDADFNALNNIVFNSRALLKIKLLNFVSYKVIGGRRGQPSIHIALNKKLAHDRENQQKRPIVVASADATKCCNMIVNHMLSLSCQHFELQLECLFTLFGTVQTIKMFLQISFRVLTTFCTGSSLMSFQMGIQCNDAAPSLWLL